MSRGLPRPFAAAKFVFSLWDLPRRLYRESAARESGKGTAKGMVMKQHGKPACGKRPKNAGNARESAGRSFFRREKPSLPRAGAGAGKGTAETVPGQHALAQGRSNTGTRKKMFSSHGPVGAAAGLILHGKPSKGGGYLEPRGKNAPGQTFGSAFASFAQSRQFVCRTLACELFCNDNAKEKAQMG